MRKPQWALLEPLLPAPGNTAGHGGRPEKHPRRRMLDAIFYLVRGGLAWRQLQMRTPRDGVRGQSFRCPAWHHRLILGARERWACDRFVREQLAALMVAVAADLPHTMPSGRGSTT